MVSPFQAMKYEVSLTGFPSRPFARMLHRIPPVHADIDSHAKNSLPLPKRGTEAPSTVEEVFMMFSRLRRSIPLFRPSCIPWIRAGRTCGRCRALCFSAYIVPMGNHLSLPNQSFGCSLSQRASRNSSFSTMRCCSGRGGRGIIVLIIFAFEIFGCAQPAPCLRKALRCDRRK